MDGVERVVTLPEDCPSSFKAYVQWLYSGRIYTKRNGDLRNYNLLAQMYALGEKLIDRDFQDRVLDAIVATVRCRNDDGTWEVPGDSDIEVIYNATPTGSPGRRLMVDFHMYFGEPKWISKSRDDVHREFALDLATELLTERRAHSTERKSYEELKNGTPCSYHHHAKGKCGGDGSG